MIFQLLLLVQGIVDLVDGTGMQQEPLGVTATTSRCNDTSAFEIGEAALMTANMTSLFPQGFPQNFSILIVAKPKIRE